MTLLAVEGLSFGYIPDQPIFSSWSADFSGGEVCAVTGPSGRGKSTLLYLLGFMLRPSAGRVCVDSVDFSTAPDQRRARLRAESFGFVFQDAALDPTRTVLDNVLETALYREQPRAEAEERALSLLERFGVRLQARKRPGQVSGGQAQRVALCRALLNDPSILLADEPTGNLDPQSASVVMRALQEQAARGSVVVVVTHDPEVVASCDRSVSL